VIAAGDQAINRFSLREGTEETQKSQLTPPITWSGAAATELQKTETTDFADEHG
jgi:hypothetical protein